MVGVVRAVEGEVAQGCELGLDAECRSHLAVSVGSMIRVRGDLDGVLVTAYAGGRDTAAAGRRLGRVGGEGGQECVDSQSEYGRVGAADDD